MWLQKQSHLEGESEEYSNLVAEYEDTKQGLVRRMEDAYSRVKGVAGGRVGRLRRLRRGDHDSVWTSVVIAG